MAMQFDIEIPMRKLLHSWSLGDMKTDAEIWCQAPVIWLKVSFSQEEQWNERTSSHPVGYCPAGNNTTEQKYK